MSMKYDLYKSFPKKMGKGTVSSCVGWHTVDKRETCVYFVLL